MTDKADVHAYIDPITKRQLTIAAAASGLSVSRFIEACIIAGIAEFRERSPIVNTALEMIESQIVAEIIPAD